MRLQVLTNGFGRLARIHLRLIEIVLGQIPGPARVTTYRKEFFGAPFLRCFHEALRGTSAWTAHERELMAAFVSHLNKCPY